MEQVLTSNHFQHVNPDGIHCHKGLGGEGTTSTIFYIQHAAPNLSNLKQTVHRAITVVFYSLVINVNKKCLINNLYRSGACMLYSTKQ